MEKVLLIEVNKETQQPEVKIIDFDTKGDNLSFYYKHLDCETIDIVRAYALTDYPLLENVSLIVDDEGLYNGSTVNILGSLLYGVLEHQQPLVGNVLVCKDVHTPDGIETGGLTDSELAVLYIVLDRLIEKYNEEVARRKKAKAE